MSGSKPRGGFAFKLGTGRSARGGGVVQKRQREGAEGLRKRSRFDVAPAVTAAAAAPKGAAGRGIRGAVVAGLAGSRKVAGVAMGGDDEGGAPRRKQRWGAVVAGDAGGGAAPQGEEAAASGNVAGSKDDAAAAERKAARRAKLAAWKAKKAKKAQAAAAAPAATQPEAAAAAPESDAKPAGGKEAPSKAPADDVDPLDAFMSALDGAAEQDGMAALPQKAVAGPAGATKVTAPTISFEEIMGGAKAGDGAADDAGETANSGAGAGAGDASAASNGGAGAGAGDVDEEEFHRTFMEELRRKREEEARAAEERAEAERKRAEEAQEAEAASAKRGVGRLFEGEDDEALYNGEEWGEQKSALEILKEKIAKKELADVDHSTIDYQPFRKRFYIEAREITNMPQADVDALRDKLEIKIAGKHCPRPVEKWEQCGLPIKVVETLRKHEYKAPFAIQRQALPVLMNGRDCIGVAKTGSGKTLAFLLPMLRHIMDQPPLEEGEGPVGLILAPARELAVQIYNEAKKFCKPLGIRAVAVYGGAGVADQIADLKRGAEVVVCTPGRMIDILTMNAGRVIRLTRVTFVVLDEADRMFDMGFEPQITKIVGNVRPDRQTALFSATFPSHVEGLARKVLKAPIRIVVGGRSVTAEEIDQHVEVVYESDKFRRLLQLLGLWYEKGSVLVFVDTQQKCDWLFQELMKAGYPCLSLHGGKDQFDRDQTIVDFKNKQRTLMVATSVGGRGLDVKDLVLVVNYSVPNHLEDYVHRVGRTGRAGKKGTAYTFITPEEGQYAGDIVKALTDRKREVPAELAALHKSHTDAVARGDARKRRSGYATRGFKFDEKETNEKEKQKKMLKRQYESEAGIEADEDDDDDDDDAAAGDEEGERLDKLMYKDFKAQQAAAEAASAAAAAAAAAPGPLVIPEGATPQQIATLKAQHYAQQLASRLAAPAAAAAAAAAAAPSVSADAAKRRAALAAMEIQKQLADSGALKPDPDRKVIVVSDELEINDYPQKARYRVLKKEALAHVTEFTGCSVISKGSYIPPGRRPGPGERKLYVLIEGPTDEQVRDAKKEVRRMLDETTLEEAGKVERGTHGKYKVL